MSVDRREFLQKSGAVVTGGLLADLGIFEEAEGAAAGSDRRPNIVLILVDEMRFPSVFPDSITTPEQFLARYLPNLFYLWQGEVRELLQRRQRMQSCACDDPYRSVPASAVAAGDADAGGLAVVAAGLSDVREAAAPARVSNPVHREMAPFRMRRRKAPLATARAMDSRG